MAKQWKNNFLVSCFTNPTLSLTICCLMPIAIVKNAEAVNEPGLAWLFTGSFGAGIPFCFLRQKIAREQGIDESCWMSACLWCFCGPCVLCQETKQLKTMNTYLLPEMQKMER